MILLQFGRKLYQESGIRKITIPMTPAIAIAIAMSITTTICAITKNGNNNNSKDTKPQRPGGDLQDLNFRPLGTGILLVTVLIAGELSLSSGWIQILRAMVRILVGACMEILQDPYQRATRLHIRSFDLGLCNANGNHP